MLRTTLVCSQTSAPILQSAFPKRLKINTLNFEQGLQSNTVNNMVTDKKGVLWVSTETGLQRYNGYSFESIQPIIANQKININYTVHLFLLENNHLWISTKDGVLEFNPFTQQFVYAIKLQQPKSNYSILPIIETTAEIWYVEEGVGICTYQKNTKKTEVVFPNLPPIFLKELISTHLVDNTSRINTPICILDSTVYMASTNTIFKFNCITRKYTFFKTSFPIIFAIEKKGTSLVVATNDKLLEINPNTEAILQVIKYSNFTKSVNPKAYLKKTNTNFLLSLNNELYELDSVFKNYKLCTKIDNSPLLSTGFINSIYADALHRIWIITNNDIKRVQFSTLPFKHYFYTSTKNNFVKSIHYNEKNHQIIAGTYGSGIQVYDSNGVNLRKSPLQNTAIKDVMNVMPLGANNYLITPYFNKWQVVNLQTEQISLIGINPLLDKLLGTSTVNFINNIKKVNNNTYLIGTSKNIFTCKIEKNVILEALPIFNFLSNNDTYLAFLQTTKNTVWTGTRNGSLFLKDPNGVIKPINNIGNYFIRSACEDSTGKIWIGTDKGLHLFTPNGQLVKTFTTANGLRNDCIYAILPVGKKASVFVSTNLGLAQVDADGSVKVYSKEIGLQENEFNTGAAFKTQSGNLLFGGINGITFFNPNDLNETEENVKIQLSRFVVNDSTYNYPSSIWKSDTIQLQHYQNHLQFDIVANGVLNADEYFYQFRVVGFEQNWQTTNKPINIRYTLDHGKYTLEIICTPILSNGQKFVKRIAIHIQPAWYQLVWVKSLFLFLTLAIVGAIVYQYQRIVYLRKIKALQIQNELQKDRERISRELHDNLGTQLSYISSNADFMIDIDDKINNAERKIKLQKINTIAKSSIADLRETIWALKKVAINVEELSERIKLYAQSYAETNTLHYIETIVNNHSISSVDALNIFRLCQEAVNNIMKYAKAKNIIITFKSNSQYAYFIELKDDGIGFDPENIKGEHYGIENMRSRAKELGAIFEINSTLYEGTTLTLIREIQKPS